MTASGQRQAAAARALRPTWPTKKRRGARWSVTDSLPNALLAATVAGFNSPDQTELTRAFVDRYFEMRGRYLARRGPMKPRRALVERPLSRRTSLSSRSSNAPRN